MSYYSLPVRLKTETDDNIIRFLQNQLNFIMAMRICRQYNIQQHNTVGSNTKLAPTTGNNSLQPTSFGLMQEEHQSEPLFLREKLLEAVDADYNVKDMPLILEVLGKLEVLNVSKEILESTRLGKTVNEFRRKVKDAVLARRLKDLLKKWRSAVIPDGQKHHPVNGTSTDGGGPGGNRSGLPANYSSGYTSASSSPILAPSSRVSPAGSYNSNSLSPRIGAMTNYTNNNTSVHSLAANRNGSSSISNNKSPNIRNPQLLSSSYANQLVSPSASATSPFLNSRSLVSPYKSRSPGGPNLTAFNSNNSNISPFPNSNVPTSASSYAPNAETVSRTNAANKRYRELDDSPLNASGEPPSKKPKSALNGTLDDPTLALDENSRDSYASRGSGHSDTFTSKDNRFSVSAPSPITPGQISVVSPQMPVHGTDSNVPSPATPLGADMPQSEVQPKRKRRKKQNEFFQDAEAILREKIAQAKTEKAAKAAREAQLRDREAALNTTVIDRRSLFEEPIPEDKLANNVFVEKYLKSQSELRLKMERDAATALSASDFQGAEESNQSNEDSLSKRERKKLKKKQENGVPGADVTVDASSFPTESQILAKLPPIDPEILKEFANFEYDVNPSPPPPPPQSSESSGPGDAFNSYNKETESVNNNLKSLSSTEKEDKPRKLLDWGDSEDEDEELKEQEKLAKERQAEAEIISQQVEAISVSDPTADYLTSVALNASENKDQLQHLLNQEQEEPAPTRGTDLDCVGTKRDISDEDVEAYTRDDVPNLNGNYDNEGQFREWHETLTVDSYQGPLYILPYTIIDF